MQKIYNDGMNLDQFLSEDLETRQRRDKVEAMVGTLKSSLEFLNEVRDFYFEENPNLWLNIKIIIDSSFIDSMQVVARNSCGCPLLFLNLDGCVVNSKLWLFANTVDVSNSFISEIGAHVNSKDVLTPWQAPAVEIMHFLNSFKPQDSVV